MLLIFALPVMQGSAIGRDSTGINLAIVNKEMNSSTGECYYENGCSFSSLSCRYLSYLNTSIIQELYEDVESAKYAVEQGNAWGAMYFTENFTDALVARIALGPDVDDETLEQSEIRVWLDKSNQEIGILLNRDLQYTYRQFAQGLLEDCETNDPSFTDNIGTGVNLTWI
jgi:hypothetical protein